MREVYSRRLWERLRGESRPIGVTIKVAVRVIDAKTGPDRSELLRRGVALGHIVERRRVLGAPWRASYSNEQFVHRTKGASH